MRSWGGVAWGLSLFLERVGDTIDESDSVPLSISLPFFLSPSLCLCFLSAFSIPIFLSDCNFSWCECNYNWSGCKDFYSLAVSERRHLNKTWIMSVTVVPCPTASDLCGVVKCDRQLLHANVCTLEVQSWGAQNKRLVGRSRQWLFNVIFQSNLACVSSGINIVLYIPYNSNHHSLIIFSCRSMVQIPLSHYLLKCYELVS